MRFWFDTEFLEDGRTIELISIGIIAEDGRHYYAETTDAKRLCARSEWLTANVLPHLEGGSTVKRKIEIVTDLTQFVGMSSAEFWSYCGAYDWVALCQLFGRMINLPSNWPYFCHELKQVSSFLGDPKLPNPIAPQHHALADARWHKLIYDYLHNLKMGELLDAKERLIAMEQ